MFDKNSSVASPVNVMFAAGLPGAVPSASSELIATVPALIVVPPLYELLPVSVMVPVGVIDERKAYSKEQLMKHLGVSQKTWDKMLDEGLKFTEIGHTRWVIGRNLIEYMERTAKTKQDLDVTDAVGAGAGR